MIWTIVIGFVIGLLARFLKPGRDPMGFILTTILGIIGSLAATYAGQALGFYQQGQPAGFIASVVGAIAVLAVYGMVTRKQA